jgi:tRNA(fMet)-specific endonuclease VapC
LVAKINLHPAGDVVVSVISFHEQALGMHSLVSQARNKGDLVKSYAMLQQLLIDYTKFTVLSFDMAAATVLDSLKAQKVRIGTMDLRIASIAQARNLTLVTRNSRDFGQVPGLRLEDLTR